MHQGERIRIFVVEDDPWYARLLEHRLTLNPEYEVRVFPSAAACLSALDEEPSLITVDYGLPDMDGSELLEKIKKYNPNIQVVIISGQEDVATALNLLREGAYDYIVKGEDTPNRLLITVANIKKTLSLEQEITRLRERIGKKYDFAKNIIGNSEKMKHVFSLIERASKANITVSIIGETGTGKELVAGAIHYHSVRKNKPFVAVNAATIPKELIESELFGHERGAFTGAVAERTGKFEQADKGTIFLDEIAELDIHLQSKLLRVLQEREITRVGGNKAVSIDVRVIVATHKNLADEVKEGRFREDLYYRLLGMTIGLPPLRERGDDVILIANDVLKKFCRENNMPLKTLSPGACLKLRTYNFPGNVRELKAVVELAAVMTDRDVLEGADLSVPNLVHKASNADLTEEMTLREYTSSIIKHYLEKYNGNVLLVAKKLNVGKSTIYRMLQKNLIDYNF